MLQAGGGAIAVIADSYSFEYIGIHISMAGLALQVFSLVVVLCLAADFASRCWRNKKKLDEKYEVIRSSRYFHGFIYGVYCSPSSWPECGFKLMKSFQHFSSQLLPFSYDRHFALRNLQVASMESFGITRLV